MVAGDRFHLIKSSAVQMEHTRTSTSTGAFASFEIVNLKEKGTRDLSSLISNFFLCVFLKASYIFSWQVSCYFEYCCKTFDFQESPHLSCDPVHTFLNDISHILITSPKIKLSRERVKWTCKHFASNILWTKYPPYVALSGNPSEIWLSSVFLPT